MNKITEIFTSWGISLNPNDKQLELASNRISICNSCEHKLQNVLSINVCGVCGCSLKQKIYSPLKNACPMGKWNELGYAEPKNLRYVMAQPATDYYVWQVESVIQNFMSLGVNPNNIDVVCYKENGVVPDNWSKLANKYPARFLFYDCTRKTRYYTSSIRPNILKQHWQRFPELKDEIIFYHDCDIIFTKRPDKWITEEMLTDDKWYGSDTRWYLSHDYIISKGEQVLDKMCDIVGISKEVVKENELNCIGAQYLMKEIDYQFWEDVERDCEILFRDITELSNEIKKDNPKYHELQIWCADMWSLLWNAWKRNKETVTHENFIFSWATSTEEEFYKYNIFHNAGVVNNKELFYKCDYMKSLPYNLSLNIKEHTASKKYYEWIQEVGRKSAIVNL